MQMPKPTDADKDRFRAVVPADTRVEVKPMFGNLGAFVNGNMFMGLFGSSLGVKLAPADAERLRAAGGGPFGPDERPMSGWTTLPPAIDRHGGRRPLDRRSARPRRHAAAEGPEGLARRAGQPVISARSLKTAATTRAPISQTVTRTRAVSAGRRRSPAARRSPPPPLATAALARWNGRYFTTSGRKIPANVSPK